MCNWKRGRAPDGGVWITPDIAMEVTDATHQAEFRKMLDELHEEFLFGLNGDGKVVARDYRNKVMAPALEYLFLPLRMAEMEVDIQEGKYKE